jgi:hypothetical protein
MDPRDVTFKSGDGVPPGELPRCAVCQRLVEGGEPVVRLHGLLVHARCAVYRRRAVSR